MKPAVEVRDLSYCYPQGKIALSHVSFVVPDDECLGLLGPNGAGKSTLLLHLNGLLPEHPPRQQSHIWIAGEPLTNATLDSVRRRVGLLFQDPDDQLISATVYEDVAFGPIQLGLDGEELKAVVSASLGMVGLTGFEDRVPRYLSHGEKRRVCLAGVLACRPLVLALDEPTSDLDPRGRREFRQLLQTLPGAKIIATHDLELVASLCSRVLVLDGGKLIVEGPTVPILSDEKLMLAHGLEKPHILQHLHPHG